MSDQAAPIHPLATSSMSGSIFRNRNFILLWCAYTTSALGDHLSEMAFLFMQDALDRPDSTSINAIMLFMFMAPYVALGPIMGWLADRLPRKWIMITADLVRALFMFSLMAGFGLLFTAFAGADWSDRLAATGKYPSLNRWLYALPLLMTGIFAAMFSPSRAAMLPTLIRTDQFVRGNGLMNAMGPIASIASVLLGAWLVKRFGPATNFRLDALTFLASATIILFIVPPPRPAVIPNQQRGNKSLILGLRYCRRHHRVVELISVIVLFWTAAGAVRSVIPALVSRAGGEFADIANYNASLAIGMLLGAMLLAMLGDVLKSEIAISWSLLGAGLSILTLAIVWIAGLGNAGALPAMFLTGMFGSCVLVSANALLQKVVPNFFRGRVFGVRDVTSMSGLLLATGLLGIPNWSNLDRFVPLILVLVAVMLLTGGTIATVVRLRRGRFGPMLTFWKNFSDFYCRFWFRTRRDGSCTIPAVGPAIVAANHNSTLDPFVLVSASPNRVMGYMIAKEYTRIPVLRSIVRSIECIPVNRSGVDTASVKAALRYLKAGKLLGIFPQGRVQDPAEPVEVREGIGMLALRSGAPVIPAYISGIQYSDAVFSPFIRRHRAVVRYGKPVDLSRWIGREKDRKAYREVAEHIVECILTLKPEGE
ncbi:MAG: MFS transporter [Phycisphaerae bacterium]